MDRGKPERNPDFNRGPPRVRAPNGGNADGGYANTEGTRVFVSNLSFTTSWQTLKDHFQAAGNVVFADVLKNRGTNRSKGVGIVEYDGAESANQAIATLNETELDGRPIRVREDQPRK